MTLDEERERQELADNYAAALLSKCSTPHTPDADALEAALKIAMCMHASSDTRVAIVAAIRSQAAAARSGGGSEPQVQE